MSNLVGDVSVLLKGTLERLDTAAAHLAGSCWFLIVVYGETNNSAQCGRVGVKTKNRIDECMSKEICFH